MKLFVQVAFDLDSSNPKYKDIETLLGQVGLTKKLDGRKLPANTFAGIRDCYASPAQAVEHVAEQFKLSAQFDGVEGQAFAATAQGLVGSNVWLETPGWPGGHGYGCAHRAPFLRTRI